MAGRRAQRALLFLLPGLGDALCSSPAIRALLEDGYELDALVMLSPVNSYCRDLRTFKNVLFYRMLDSAMEFVRAVLHIRRERYDVAVLPFPAARWQYHLLLGLCGAKRTVTHEYGLRSRIPSIFRLGKKSVSVALSGGQRAAENYRLCRDRNTITPADLSYLMPESWRTSEARVRDEAPIVGIASGSMRYKGNETRRWALENFLAVAKDQLAVGRRVRFFIGPNELEDESIIRAQFNHSAEIVKESLDRAAQSMTECSVLVANDAGLAHVAAGLDVPTVVLFGMTDPVRATPVGPAIAVRPSDCSPCNDEGARRFECRLNLDYRCLKKDLTPEAVFSAINAAIERPVEHTPVLESPFRLYGRPSE